MDRLVSPEASTARKFDRVKDAGFDGMAIDLGALSFSEAEATVPHFARTGLLAGLTAFPKSVEELRPALGLAHRISAPYVVVVGQEMPVELDAMIPVIEGWLRVAEQEGMPIQFETTATASPMICSRRCNCSMRFRACDSPPICRITSWIVRCPARPRRPCRR